MNVQEYIKAAITEIVAGVAEAREEVKEYGASAGADSLCGHVRENEIMTDVNSRLVSHVEFDIALAEAVVTDTKGGIGVFLGAVGLVSKGASSSNSRIKLKVPVVLLGQGAN